MPREFSPVTLEGRDAYLVRLAACPGKTSDYSFANLYGWSEEYGLEWSFGEAHVWLRQTKPQTIMWAPVGPWTGVDWSDCPTLAEGATITRVPQALADIWREQLGARVILTPAREHFDYVYSVPELVALKGNKFHKKKNLLSQFVKSYDYTYAPLCRGRLEEALQLQAEWCQWRDCEPTDTLAAENRAIFRVMLAFEDIPGLLGGTLAVGGKMAAYTVAEPLGEDSLIIHFEKGMPGFKGVYQAINQMFLAAQGERFSLVNREQDLGDEGLRQAKMSYHPVFFLEKFTAEVAPAG